MHSAFNFPFMKSAWDADALRAVIDATAGSDIGIVSIGSCDGAIHEAMAVLP